MSFVRKAGYELGNIDATVAAEQPKLSPHISTIKNTLAEVMQTDPGDISVKATTTERLGFTGRQEGVAAYATALIFYA
jgi:2-C-methyl-D-erythritol 2,4-cyclodiphosphate synthase